jgi:hypothetical protein
MLEKQQRLRAGVGQQANLPEEPPVPSRDEKSKAEIRGRVIDQPPKAGQVVDPGTDLWDRGQHSKLNCPTLLREELTKQSCN